MQPSAPSPDPAMHPDVIDVAARHAARQVSIRWEGLYTDVRAVSASCTCGWGHHAAPGDEPRTLQAAIDRHMLGILPAWQPGARRCGCAMLRWPGGAWLHAAEPQAFMGHRARPR